ncbi:hypothetical protein ACHAXA_006239 [Cyclostephanos tholiformis]|uniref:CID domain-containing protein n=1 Tax=Cyclostephanos tholiformis TaxID=382380 RepID=A0ABD3SEA5_9STRA
MSDAADLRATLLKTDTSAPAIQSSSRAMMRFYDRPGGAATAVSEWRSALQSSSPSRHLPLLYVANEVLQTSKRNRGNKFLEAFSPVLGSSLIYMCGKDKNVTEKVRRTVKIWGDRRVFSMRYVTDVLSGLEPYRDGGGGGPASATAASLPVGKALAGAHPNSKSPSVSVTTNSDDDDERDGMFGGDGQKLLDVSIDATALSAAARKASGGPSSPEFGAGAKRRRQSAGSPTPQSGSSAGPVVKKSKALSGQNFLDLFQTVVDLDERYKSCIGVVEAIPPSYLDESSTDIDDLVGDELTDMYKRVCQAERNVRRERRTMYSIAVRRRDLETEARRYVSWLRNLAKADDDDIDFCDKLEAKLDLISVCHEEAKSLRDKHRADEARRRIEAEEARKRAVEDEERRRILDDAKMEAEAKPGMVWNKEAREYQYVHDPTEESWRD